MSNHGGPGLGMLAHIPFSRGAVLDSEVAYRCMSLENSASLPGIGLVSLFTPMTGNCHSRCWGAAAEDKGMDYRVPSLKSPLVDFLVSGQLYVDEGVTTLCS